MTIVCLTSCNARTNVEAASGQLQTWQKAVFEKVSMMLELLTGSQQIVLMHRQHQRDWQRKALD